MSVRCSPSPGFGAATSGPVKKERAKDRPRGLAFLTTTPNKPVATINHDRMPVLLTREEEFDAWLNGAPRIRMRAGVSARADAHSVSGVQKARFAGSRRVSRWNPNQLNVSVLLGQ